jgi:hypothetical protein
VWKQKGNQCDDDRNVKEATNAVSFVVNATDPHVANGLNQTNEGVGIARGTLYP